MRAISAVCLLAFVAWTATADDQYDDPQTFPNRTVIVHLFEWKHSDVAKECENFLSKYEYGAVQISPPNEHIYLEDNGDYPWYTRYQPVSYDLKSRSGNKQELQDMVSRWLDLDKLLEFNGVGTSGDNSFDGNKNSEQFPGVPFGPSDFNDIYCDRDISDDDYRNSKYNVKTCRLAKLLDLDQGKGYVQDRIVDYLNSLVDLGFAGFRADAAKHMWPDDLKTIFDRVKNLRSDIFGQNQRPFIVCEIIDQGGEAVNLYEYENVGRYTNFNFGAYVTQAMWRNVDISTLADLKEGFNYGNGNTNKVLNFTHPVTLLPAYIYQIVELQHNKENNQRDMEHRSVLNYNDGIKYKMGVAYMLAWDYGYPRVMSSYYFSNHNQGPPNTGKDNGYATSSPQFDSDDFCTKESGWVCEHRWFEIREMVKFRHAATGTSVSDVQRGDQMLAFARKGKGYLALRNADYDYKLNNVQTTLPAGDYCDIFTGGKKDNKCVGTKITVDKNGVSSFAIPPNSGVAFYVDTKLT
ncbi:nucleoprotein [Aphelenchoides bicaudatus]|nr:nucleoprotein [Aphelenchoides bicaudatus]